MSEIINFPNGEQEEECCPFCTMVELALLDIEGAEDKDEVADILHTLVRYGREAGYRECLVDQLNTNLATLNALEGCDCDECDGSCEID